MAQPIGDFYRAAAPSGQWILAPKESQNQAATFSYRVNHEDNVLEVNALAVSTLARKDIPALVNSMTELSIKKGCKGHLFVYAANMLQVNLSREGFKVKSAVADDFSEIDPISPKDADADLSRGQHLEWDILKMYRPSTNRPQL